MPSYYMAIDKLYVMITCTMCKGTREMTHAATHRPMRPHMWKACPYCDDDGKQIIEASYKTIGKYLQQLPKSALNTIIELLTV
jgi:DnaJ-class molecular chaperone